MKTFILFFYLSSILFSAIMAFIYRKGLKRRNLFILLPYLFLVAIQEIGVYFYIRQSPTASTGIIYNIYRPITVLVFSALYYRIPFKPQMKKIILVLLSIYLIFAAVTFTFLQSIFTFSNYAGTVGGLIITCYGIFFLFFYFDLDNTTQEKQWQPMILITIGLVTFYPVINISNAFHKHLLAYEATLFGMRLYNLIPQLMSIFMYGCFARAFYLCRNKN